jgi:hypothetical protein
MSLMSVAAAPDLRAAGYREGEYALSGLATRYAAIDLPADGRFEIEPVEDAPFTTRVVCRAPTDPAQFSGTAVVEWLNVSSGQDAAPDYTYMSDEIVRGGHAWIGVSAQYTGVHGGSATVALGVAAPQGLVEVDPERYSSLDHPGDGYSYSIFSRVIEALRHDESTPLPHLEIQRVLAVGESQSAIALTTYVNAIAPRERLADGFVIHSRGGAPMPLGEPGKGIDLVSALTGPATRIRDDLDVPVIIVQTETDLFGHLRYHPARQEDSPRLRLWEVAGSAHADKFQIGDFESFLGCPTPVNRGHQRFVVRAALRHLDAWVRDGIPAPTADRMAVTEFDGEPEFVTDEEGNVIGGVRTPSVEAPTAVLSGFSTATASRICQLFGSTRDLPVSTLAAMYGTPDAYVAEYAAAADDAIARGFCPRRGSRGDPARRDRRGCDRRLVSVTRGSAGPMGPDIGSTGRTEPWTCCCWRTRTYPNVPATFRARSGTWLTAWMW